MQKRYAVTDLIKVFSTSLQNKNNNTKWNNYLVSPTFLIIIGISI